MNTGDLLKNKKINIHVKELLKPRAMNPGKAIVGTIETLDDKSSNQPKKTKKSINKEPIIHRENKSPQIYGPDSEPEDTIVYSDEDVIVDGKISENVKIDKKRSNLDKSIEPCVDKFVKNPTDVRVRHSSGSTINQTKTKVYLKNIMYVDAHSISHDAIKITKGQQLTEHGVQFYDISYSYGDQSQNQLEESMNILCKDLMMCQKRYGAYIYSDNSCSLPLNTQSDSFHSLDDAIRTIRSTVIDHILKQNIPMLDVEHAQMLRDKRIDLEMMRKGKLCKIVKLGSKTENHVNTQIRSIEEFNNLLKDYKYNKINTDSFYKADVVIAFRCSVYRRDNEKYIVDEEGDEILNPKTDPYNMVISFVPYLKLVEMRYNRAWCVPMINTDNKIVALDNVLVL